MILKLGEIERAAGIVAAQLQPTPQIRWPLLDEASSARVVVKHEKSHADRGFQDQGRHHLR